MCRVLAYLGDPALIDDLLFKPDSSLIKQTYNPQQSPNMLNLAGFGMASWDGSSYAPSEPYVYHTASLPFHDRNLKDLSLKHKTNCMIAHIRGVRLSVESVISSQNLHPFLFKNCKIALAHNGDLAGYQMMKRDFLSRMKQEIAAQIIGSTDTELVYALLLSQFEDPYAYHTVKEVKKAVVKTLQIIGEIRERHGENKSSPLNLFISNGEYLVIVRYVFNYGAFRQDVENPNFFYHTLWYTYGEDYGLFDGEYKTKGSKKRRVIFASEPLTKDVTTWIPVSEYSLMTAEWEGEEVKINNFDLGF